MKKFYDLGTWLFNCYTLSSLYFKLPKKESEITIIIITNNNNNKNKERNLNGT